MSYAKSVFFIPVWFDEYKTFTKALHRDNRWGPTDLKKLWAAYLFRYASNTNRADFNLMSSFTLKDPFSLNVYMFEKEIGWADLPTIEEVRLSCFASGVGFMEFWVSYTDKTPDEIATFSYYFKKATRAYKKELLGDRRSLYDVALDLLPKKPAAKLFFSSASRIAYECNCYHFLHLDQPVPDEDNLNATLSRLSRSYLPDMPVALDSSCDMVYQASDGDYWSGCTEGFANIVYDDSDHCDEAADYYLHTIKPQTLKTNFYFMYLLLLHQRYAALHFIDETSQITDDRALARAESLSKRIIWTQKAFYMDVISDDTVVQSLYSQMYDILGIRNLLDIMSRNESHMQRLQEYIQRDIERRSNRILMFISLVSIISVISDLVALQQQIGNKLWATPFALSFSTLLLIIFFIINRKQ